MPQQPICPSLSEQTNSGNLDHGISLGNRKKHYWGAWVAQLSIRLLILAQVMISWFVSSSPHQAFCRWHRACLKFPLPLFLSVPFSLSLSKINTFFFKNLRDLFTFSGDGSLENRQYHYSLQEDKWTHLSGKI